MKVESKRQSLEIGMDRIRLPGFRLSAGFSTVNPGAATRAESKG
jgi:hypothetical protein